MMRSVIIRSAMAALLSLAIWATPAAASQIIYTLTGNTAAGSPFTITGSGDTSAVFGFFGDVSAIPTVQLTSNSITVGANSGSVTGNLYFFDNHSAAVSGFNINLANDFINFSNSAFSTYGAVTAIGPLSVSQTFGQSFNTSFGAVDLSNSTNLSFQAVLGAAAVPEPATWAMMLLGFGAIGMATRRARRSLPQAA